MAYVITSRCQSNCLQDCVKACPVDAIHGPIDAEHVLSARASGRPLDPSLAKVQMFIDPETCIDCNMCTETCPGFRFGSSTENIRKWTLDTLENKLLSENFAASLSWTARTGTMLRLLF